MTIVQTDTFAGRTVASGWGTASDGTFTWGGAATGSPFSVASGEGVVGPGGSFLAVAGTTQPSADGEILFRFSASSTKNDQVTALFRSTSTSDSKAGNYTLGYNTPTSSPELAIYKWNGGSQTTLWSASIAQTANSYYWIRARVQGSTLSVKYWADGSSEPAGWTGTATDTTFTAAGVCGFRIYSADTVHIDHYTFDNLLAAPTTGAATLTGHGTLSATGQIASTNGSGSATLTGHGTLVATAAAPTLSASATLSGRGTLHATPNPVPWARHVFLIAFENTSYSDVIGNANAPYINSLIAAQGAAFSNYSPQIDPSLPNYLAVTGGSTFGVADDNNPPANVQPSGTKNITDVVTAAGLTWKSYMQSMTTDYQTTDSGTSVTGDGNAIYMAHHNPFVYYADISQTNGLNAPLGTSQLDYSTLANDLANPATAPTFVWITPDADHEMHNGTSIADAVVRGDTWLQAFLPTILNSPTWQQGDGLIILWCDENDATSGTTPTWLVLYGPRVQPNGTSATAYNHYSTLATIEHALRTGSLGQNDASATVISDVWQAPSTHTAGAAFTGHGTLSVSTTQHVIAGATLAGHGRLSASGIQQLSADATLPGHGTLAASAVQHVAASATLAGQGVLSASASQQGQGGAVLPGHGTLSVTAIQRVTASATLPGHGSLSASGVQHIAGDATLSGHGTLSATPAVQHVSGSASFTGHGTLAAAAGVQHVAASATLAGRGSLAAAAVEHILASVTLSGHGTLSASGHVAGQAGATLSGHGTLSAAGVQHVAGSATLSARGQLVAQAVQHLSGTATLPGHGTLSAGPGTQHVLGAATLPGQGRLSVSGQVRGAATATLVGHGSLSATGTQTHYASATLRGQGALVASGNGLGTLHGWRGPDITTTQNDAALIGATQEGQ